MKFDSAVKIVLVYAGLMFSIVAGGLAEGAEHATSQVATPLYPTPAPPPPEAIEQTQTPSESKYIGLLLPAYTQSEIPYPSYYPWIEGFIATFDAEGTSLKTPERGIFYRPSRRPISANRSTASYAKGAFAAQMGSVIQNFDVMVALGEMVTDAFIADYEALSHPAIVFCSHKEITPEFQKKHPLITGVVIVPQIIKTIELGLKLFPNPQQIVVITDDVETDPDLNRQVQDWILKQGGKISPPQKTEEGFLPAIATGLPAKVFGKHCKIILISGTQQNSREMLEVVRRMPSSSFIVMSNWRNFYRDKFRFFPDLVKEMDLSQHPLFTLAEFPYPKGALGGYMSLPDDCAKKVVELTRQALDSPAGTIIPPVRDEGRLVIDEEVMRHFKLDLRALPPDTILKNQTFPVWVAYKEETLIAVISFAVVLSLLVGLILFHHRYVHLTRRTEAMFDTLPLRIFAVDANGHYLFQQVESELRNSLTPLEKMEGTDEIDPPLVRNAVNEVMQSGLSSTIRYQFRDQVRMAQLHRLEKDIFGKKAVLCVSQDITAIDENERKLEAAMNAAQSADRAKSYFIAMMSHELRTPLNSVIGFSQLLQMEDISAEEQKEYVNLIYVADNNLLNIINDVLDLSKIEAEQLQIVPKRIDLAALLKEVTQLFRQKAEAKGLQLVLDFSSDFNFFFLDSLRLRQVIINLVGNATKFTSAGSIDVSAKFEPTAPLVPRPEHFFGKLTLKVKDTGVGIKKDFLERVFEPFIQEDVGSIRGNRSYEGTGLGLTISRRMISLMGGTLTLESEEGKGSTFIITLPQVEYDPISSIAPPTHTPQDLSIGQEHQVLLVDDVIPNLQMIEAMFKKMGFKTLTASSGARALEILQTQSPDLVVTDLWMPQMTGAELAQAIRKDPRLSHLKLIALSADIDAQSNFDTSFFDEIILKPFNLDQLRKCLKKELPT